MKKTKKAFSWIVKILRENKIPFQIIGGFAARFYGAKRDLADIDIIMPTNRIADIIPSIEKYIIFGPKQYRDESWDCFVVTLKYAGQEIDICGIETIKIFNRATKKWERLSCQLTNAKKSKIFGISTSVVPMQKLIEYKRKLLRRVDKSDIKELTGISENLSVS